MKRILVAGPNGPLGQHVVDALKERDTAVDIRTFSTSPSASPPVQVVPENAKSRRTSRPIEVVPENGGARLVSPPIEVVPENSSARLFSPPSEVVPENNSARLASPPIEVVPENSSARLASPPIEVVPENSSARLASPPIEVVPENSGARLASPPIEVVPENSGARLFYPPIEVVPEDSRVRLASPPIEVVPENSGARLFSPPIEVVPENSGARLFSPPIEVVPENSSARLASPPIEVVPENARASGADLGLMFGDEAFVKDVDVLIHYGPDALEDEMIEAARVAAVRRVIHVSTADEATPAPRGQTVSAIAARLAASGLEWRIVQAPGTMQTIDVSAAVRSGVLALPCPANAPLPLVDLADVAQVIALLSASDGRDDAIYDLVGNEVLTGTDMAAIVSRVSGQPIRAELTGDGPPSASSSPVAAAAGEQAGRASQLRELLGRDPGSFEAFVRRELGTPD